MWTAVKVALDASATQFPIASANLALNQANRIASAGASSGQQVTSAQTALASVKVATINTSDNITDVLNEIVDVVCAVHNLVGAEA